MSSKQGTMPDHSVDEEEFEDCENVRDDLRRKQSRYGIAGFRASPIPNQDDGDTTAGLSHDTKVRLAVRVSAASMPGAFSSDEVSPNMKPSQAQLEEISRLRAQQKRRQQSNGEADHGDSTGMSVDDLVPITDLQERMSTFKDTTHDEIAEEEKTLSSRKKRFYMKVGGICAILIAAVVGSTLGAVFASQGGQQNGANATETNEPSSSLYVDGCLNSNDGLSSRFMAMRDLAISVLSGSKSGSVVDSFGSPSRAALCWVADADSYQIDVVQGEEYMFIERFAFGAVYYHFVGTTFQGDNGLSTSNWLSPIPVCQWDFLSCGNRTDTTTVHSLLLKSLELKGSIPAELTLLTKLTHLDLAYNSLSGSMPVGIWNMSQLEVLDVSVNTLTGSISSRLSQFTNLIRLHLDNNRFSGIFPDIVQLTSLVDLKIGRNSVQVIGFFNVLNFTQLETLDLSATFLTGSIPLHAFTQLPNLKYLELQETDLYGSIPTDLGARLVHLDISTTQLTGSIPIEIGNFSELQYLSMAFMPLLTGTIPSEIGNLSRLESIDVSNSIGLTGTMPSEICALRLKSLSKLATDDNIKCNCCTAG